MRMNKGLQRLCTICLLVMLVVSTIGKNTMQTYATENEIAENDNAKKITEGVTKDITVEEDNDDADDDDADDDDADGDDADGSDADDDDDADGSDADEDDSDDADEDNADADDADDEDTNDSVSGNSVSANSVSANSLSINALKKARVGDEENLAYGKATGIYWANGESQTGNEDRSYRQATDGIISGENNDCTQNYGEFGTDHERKSSYLAIALDKVYSIDKMNLWRYWDDSRTYDATVIVGSETVDFKKYTVLYNSDSEDIHGFGTGHDEAYEESVEGKEIIVTEDNAVQYLRIYMYGSNKGDTNHIVEFQAYGDEVIEEELTNVALKCVTSLHMTEDDKRIQDKDDKPSSMAVDGIYTSYLNYAEFGADESKDSRYLQLDLGGVATISRMNLWRYWEDGRTYDGTVIAVSKTADFKNPVIVYNSDSDGFHGFAAGKDKFYEETEAGKEIVFDKTEAQYVRVYMCGRANKEGNTNHIVELQVWGSMNEVEPEEATAALPNADAYLDFPTYYNELNSISESDHISGQVTHPDVQVLNHKWNGYKYWMVYTPNLMKTSQYENPCIVASNDGQNWEVPEGTDNPLVDLPVTTQFHNCDCELVYDEQNDRMMLYWNWVDDAAGGVSEIRALISYDGQNWGTPYDENGDLATTRATVVSFKDREFINTIRSTDRYSMLSPTITYDNYRKIYVMWANNAGDVGYYNGAANRVEQYYSYDGLSWEKLTATQNFLNHTTAGEQLNPWHQDIQYVASLGKYVCLSQCFTGGAPDGSMLYITVSEDGVHWTQLGTDAILNPGKSGSWDDFQIYRSTFYFDNSGEEPTFRVWYAALQENTAGIEVIDSKGDKTITAGLEDSRVWRIGYTENTWSKMMDIILGDQKITSIPCEALTLSAKTDTLEVGKTLSITTTFSPSNTSNQNVIYQSADEAVATVSIAGEITAVSEGTTTITAISQEGISGSMELTVTKKEIVVLPDESVLEEIPNDSILGAVSNTYHNGDGEGDPAYATDDDPSTIWHSGYDADYDEMLKDGEKPYLQLNFSAEPISKVTYLPRQTGTNGIITEYELYAILEDGNEKLVAEGTFANNSELKTIRFATVNAVGIKLVAISSVGGHASAAEVKTFRVTEENKDDQDQNQDNQDKNEQGNTDSNKNNQSQNNDGGHSYKKSSGSSAVAQVISQIAQALTVTDAETAEAERIADDATITDSPVALTAELPVTRGDMPVTVATDETEGLDIQANAATLVEPAANADANAGDGIMTLADEETAKADAVPAAHDTKGFVWLVALAAVAVLGGGSYFFITKKKKAE